MFLDFSGKAFFFLTLFSYHMLETSFKHAEIPTTLEQIIIFSKVPIKERETVQSKINLNILQMK